MGAMGVLMVLACAICAGRAITAWRRATFNPLVQGSTPWRPTRQNVVLIMVLVAGEGLRRDRSADGPRDPPAQDMKDRTGGADRTRQAAGAGRDGTSARDERDGD